MLLTSSSVGQHIVLGVDIGTTNLRCYAYDQFANVVGKADARIPILCHHDGKHEIKPPVLWNVFQKVVKECLRSSHLKAENVTSLGISSQRATFVTWDRETGETFHNFITWKDKRANNDCYLWNSSLTMKLFRFAALILYMVTRLKKFQVFSRLELTSTMVLLRLCWVLEHITEVRQKSMENVALFGTMDTWLVWKLTGGAIHATDASNACVTGFFDPFKMEWSSWILKFFNIPRNILPVVKNTSDYFGITLPEIFGASVPINAVVGDQQASMFGACCFKKGDINCTMGTGSFLNINTGSSITAIHNGIVPLVGWTIKSNTTYLSECGVHDTGTAVTWAQKLGLFGQPSESSCIAESVSDSDGLYFLPVLNSLQISRYEASTSAFVGLKLQTSKEHMVRSILEALAFQICLIFECLMQENGNGLKSNAFRICGGISRNDFVVQLISDLTAQPVYRLKHCEISSLGAAFLAGLYSGIWKNQDDLLSIEKECDKFSPNPESVQKYYKKYMKWKRVISDPIWFTL